MAAREAGLAAREAALAARELNLHAGGFPLSRRVFWACTAVAVALTGLFFGAVVGELAAPSVALHAPSSSLTFIAVLLGGFVSKSLLVLLRDVLLRTLAGGRLFVISFFALNFNERFQLVLVLLLLLLPLLFVIVPVCFVVNACFTTYFLEAWDKFTWQSFLQAWNTLDKNSLVEDAEGNSVKKAMDGFGRLVCASMFLLCFYVQITWRFYSWAFGRPFPAEMA